MAPHWDGYRRLYTIWRKRGRNDQQHRNSPKKFRFQGPPPTKEQGIKSKVGVRGQSIAPSAMPDGCGIWLKLGLAAAAAEPQCAASRNKHPALTAAVRQQLKSPHAHKSFSNLA